MLETEDIVAKAKRWPQYVAALVAILSSLSNGSTLGWSAPALPYIEGMKVAENDSFTVSGNETFTNYTSRYVTEEESSLIGSLLPIGALCGSFPAGFMCENFGRRTTLQIANVFLIAGWAILCTVDRNVAGLFIARILHGCALGICSVAVPLYNEEIAEVQIRGAIGVFYDFSIALGILWIYVFGTITTYLWMNISCAVLTVASIIGLMFVPETPIFLLKKLRDEKAKNALEWLRGVNSKSKYDINSEFNVLQRIVDLSQMKSGKDVNKRGCFMKQLKCKHFSSPTAKALYIIVFLMVLRQFGGINPLTFYTVHIFQETGSSISPYLSTTISGLIQLLLVFVAFASVDRLGRRILLLLSCSTMAVSLLILSIFFYLKQNNYDTEPYSWLPILCIGLYFAMFSIGLGPIPWFMMAELVPTQSKGWVTGICSMTNWLCTFVSVQVFLIMLRDIGSGATYLFYCIVNIVGFILIIFVIPETKNKSIETIQEELSKMRLKCK